MKNRGIDVFYCWVTIMMLLSCSESEPNIGHSGGKELLISPDKEQRILLSDLITDFRLVFLETDSNSIFGQIDKIRFHDSTYFVLDKNTSKSLLLFNAEGRYVNRIGAGKNGTDEIFRFNSFALDTAEKHIIIDDNHKQLKTFDYKGNMVSARDLNLISKDFELLKDGSMVFSSSKFVNYQNGEERAYELWVETEVDSFRRYLPFDIELFPNGSEHPDIYSQFSSYQNKLFFYYPLNDIIFEIENGVPVPAYHINFGPKGNSTQLSKLQGQEVFEFFIDDPDNAFMVQNFVEIENVIKFDYFIGNRLHSAIINKQTGEVSTGKIVNDLFGVDLIIRYGVGSKLIAFVNPVDLFLLLQDETNVTKPWYEKLHSLFDEDDYEGNMCLVELTVH